MAAIVRGALCALAAAQGVADCTQEFEGISGVMFGLLRQLESVLAVKGMQVCFSPANTGRGRYF
jgi:hypothetical protein